MIKIINNFMVFIILIRLNDAKISCIDENGENVDWYYLYKLPSSYPNSQGLKYLYLSSNQHNDWKLSNLFINDTKSYPSQTLKSIFNDKTILSIAYNDEIPNGTTNNIDGHTKGIISADSNTGFWLIHSVPKYPNIDNYLIYPKNGEHYGQSFLCVTFNRTEIIKISKQLIFNEPNIYYYNFPLNLENLYSNFINVFHKKWINIGPFYNQELLISSNGVKFHSFAKSKKFKKELYEDWIAPILNVDLFVETWRKGEGNLPSNCSKFRHVLNINQIKMISLQYSFKSTNDHSKWAVSAVNGTTIDSKNPNKSSSNSNWICVGDINRQNHQLQRAGGTLCQLNSNIAQIYRKLILNFEKCSNFTN